MDVAHVLDSERLFGPQLTLEEWADLPHDVPGELVDGRLVEEEVPEYLHEVVVAWLVRVVGNWAEDSGAVVASSDAKFGLSDKTGRKPDVTVYFAGCRPPARGLIRIPPDMAMEVVSPGRRNAHRDRVEKFEEYAEFGIRFYWLVDPESRSLEIYELHGSAYRRAILQNTGTVSNIPGCPELTLDLDALWRKLSELAE